MKVAFSGTQCVGKTTTINLIRNSMIKSQNNNDFSYLKDHRFGESKTHPLLKLGLNLNDGADDLAQTIILSNYLQDVVEENYISDRCLLDVLVYTEYQYNHSKCSSELYNLTLRFFNKYIDNYDFIFYLPPEIPIIENGIRSMDGVYRDELHTIFLKYINRDNIFVVNGKPTYKKYTIDKIIKEHLKLINN